MKKKVGLGELKQELLRLQAQAAHTDMGDDSEVELLLEVVKTIEEKTAAYPTAHSPSQITNGLNPDTYSDLLYVSEEEFLNMIPINAYIH